MILSLKSEAQVAQCNHKIFNHTEAESIEQSLSAPSTGTSSETCNKIRIVVHVVYDSEASNPSQTGEISRAQVLSQIRIANQFFRNDSLMFSEDNTALGYELELATIDPEGNYSDGINYYDGTSLFGSEWSEFGLQNNGDQGIPESELADAIGWEMDQSGMKYLNCYVVSKIDGSNIGGVQAYAYFPTSSNVYGNYNLYNTFGASQLQEEYGEVFNLKSFTDMGLTWPHEVLHNFAIFHTFQGGSCAAESNPLIQGDRVPDTPPQTQGVGCSGSCGFLSNNVMDYISESCKDRITQGQVDRVGLVISNSLTDYLVCAHESFCDNDSDFNNDGFVNILDASMFSALFGCSADDENGCFNEMYDLNCDGHLNIVDISLLVSEF